MRRSAFRVLVAGDYMLDHYYWGRCERISPEAPVPILEVQRETWTLGGAGNVVKNLLALGLEAQPLGLRGQDQGGQRLSQLLATHGLDLRWLEAEPDRLTTLKSRLIAGQQQMLRFDQERRMPLSPELADRWLNQLQDHWQRLDAVLISDYAKGVMTESFTQKLIQAARGHAVPVFVDPKGQDYRKYRGATLITPNRKEAQQVAGVSLDEPAVIAQAAERLRQALDLECVVITLSEDGMAYHDGTFAIVPTTAREVFDVTGAGDTSLVALMYAWLMGYEMSRCARFANAAAAVVIAKVGSETASLAEIEAHLSASS